MKVIGLTGGIATGVSTVAAMLREKGAVLIQADQVAREVVRPGTEPYRQIVEAFGPSVVGPDGTLDRRRLGAIVFADPAARDTLNRLTHPAIRERIRQEVARIRSVSPRAVVVIDAPLLLDTARPDVFGLDGVIVVLADRETQLRRLMARDGLSRADAQRRLDAQRPVAEKAAEADWTIDNSGSLDATRRQVDALWPRLQDP